MQQVCDIRSILTGIIEGPSSGSRAAAAVADGCREVV